MRIGHYAEGIFHPGGICSYVRRVTQGQLARGHQIVLFHAGDAGENAKHADGPLEVRRACTGVDLLQEAVTLGLDVLHAHTLVELPDELPARRPALVRTMHGHEAYCPSGTRFLAQPVGRPCPRAYHLAGCTWGHFVNRCGSIRPRELAAHFRRVHRERQSAERFSTVAISDFVRQQMIRGGYDPGRIMLVHNPAPGVAVEDRPPSAPGGGGNTFLFLGRLVPSKGLPWLLRAAARLELPFRLQVAGAGPQEAEWRRLADALGIGTRVEWLGWLDEGQVRARMTEALAVVFPSLWHEPAGLITAEAAACARPVIASNVGGIPEYAAQLGHALLVPPGDVGALADAMTRLLSDPPLAARLGLAGWERLQTGVLGLTEHLAGLEAVYEFASRADN